MAKIKYDYVIEHLEKDLKRVKKVYREWKKESEKKESSLQRKEDSIKYLKFWEDIISQLKSAIELMEKTKTDKSWVKKKIRELAEFFNEEIQKPKIDGDLLDDIDDVISDYDGTNEEEVKKKLEKIFEEREMFCFVRKLLKNKK